MYTGNPNVIIKFKAEYILTGLFLFRFLHHDSYILFMLQNIIFIHI